MKLNQLFSLAEISKEIQIPETWGQGRTVFGGLIAALLIKQAQHLVSEKNKTLRSVSITFVGPVLSGVSAEIQSKILRSSQSSSIIEVQLIQNSEIQTTIIACFGIARSSIIKVDHPFDKPNLKPREELNLIPYIPSLMPEFTQHFDFLLADGGMPISKSSRSDFSGWMRFKESENISEIELAHLFILMDMWPTSVIQMFDRPAPSSTLTWNFDMIGIDVDYSKNLWWQFEVESEYAQNGYNYEVAKLWDENGNLISVGRQTVAIYL
jgi:acyl-CoA thioesterase